MTKISIYKASDFTSKGMLKKRAKAEYQTEVESLDAGKMADYLKYLGYKDFSSPYFFTHIKAKSPYHDEEVKIFQDVYINGNKFITSPKELLIHLI